MTLLKVSTPGIWVAVSAAAAVLVTLGVTAAPLNGPETAGPPTTDLVTPTTVAATPTTDAGRWFRVPTSQLGVASGVVFLDVASTPFGFLASGFHGLLISDDGTSWEPIAHDTVVLGGELSDNVFLGLATSDIGTLAFGTETAWFTPNGETWSEVDFPLAGPERRALPSVAAASEGFVVAVGSRLWVSADGFDWVEVRDVPRSRARQSEIESTPFGFVAGGELGGQEMVWTSPDGTQWTRWDQVMDENRASTSSPPEFWITDVAGSSLGIVAVSTSGETWYSQDGIEWHRSMLPIIEIDDNHGYVVGASDFGFLVATARNNRELINQPRVSGQGAPPVYVHVPSAWFSTDGLTWTSVPYETAYESGHVPLSLQEIVPRGTGFLIVGEPEQDDTRDLGDAGPVWIYEP